VRLRGFGKGSSMQYLLTCALNRVGHSRLEDDLDASVLLVSKYSVKFGRFVERGNVRDYKGWVDLAVFNQFQKPRQVMLNRGLRHSEGPGSVDGTAPWNLVKKTAIDAYNRHGSEVAAAVNGLTEHMRSVGT